MSYAIKSRGRTNNKTFVSINTVSWLHRHCTFSIKIQLQMQFWCSCVLLHSVQWTEPRSCVNCEVELGSRSWVDGLPFWWVLLSNCFCGQSLWPFPATAENTFHTVAAAAPFTFHRLIFHIPWQWQHHSIFIQHFSIYRGSGNTTQFSYNTCFPDTVAVAKPLNFHTLIFHMLWQQH